MEDKLFREKIVNKYVNKKIEKKKDEGIIKKRINGQWLELPNPDNTFVDTVDNVSTSTNIIPQNK